MCLGHDHETAAPECASPSIDQLVDRFALALTNARIYSTSHPRVREALEGLVAAIRTTDAARAGEPLVLGAADGCLFHEGRPLLAASRSAPRLLALLRDSKAGGLSIEPGVRVEDLAAFFSFVHSPRRRGLPFEAGQRALRESGCARVTLLPGYKARTAAARRGSEAQAGAEAPEANAAPRVDRLAETGLAAVRVHETAFTHLESATARVLHGHTLDLDETRTVVEQILTQLDVSASALQHAAHYGISEADQFQFRHSIRVACLALDFLRHFTTDTGTLLRVGAAALLHDVGKARVPYEVLHCPTKLDDEAWAEMRRHTEHGADILLELGGADALAVTVALTHHHLPSGTGYPPMRHRTRPEDVSQATRLVRICDVYEALTGYRPYRQAIAPVEAYRTMAGMRDHFDLALLHLFVRTNGLYPVGSQVELQSGARGRVVAQGEDLGRPRVVDAAGNPLDPAEGEVVRLLADLAA